jgi:hypothetical protein
MRSSRRLRRRGEAQIATGRSPAQRRSRPTTPAPSPSCNGHDSPRTPARTSRRRSRNSKPRSEHSKTEAGSARTRHRSETRGSSGLLTSRRVTSRRVGYRTEGRATRRHNAMVEALADGHGGNDGGRR